jgi:hypothetical protein
MGLTFRFKPGRRAFLKKAKGNAPQFSPVVAPPSEALSVLLPEAEREPRLERLPAQALEQVAPPLRETKK